MAKTTKKSVAVSEQAPKQLEELLVTKQADLLGYKKGLAAGELKNTGVIKATRRDIARIKTALTAGPPDPVRRAGKEGDK